MKTETEYNHTPGPWTVEGGGYTVIARDSNKNQYMVMTCDNSGILNSHERKANIKLAASAPSLLQERDTFKDRCFELEGMLSKSREANNELIEHVKQLEVYYEQAVECMKNVCRQIPNDENLANYSFDFCETVEQGLIDYKRAALLKHRKGE